VLHSPLGGGAFVESVTRVRAPPTPHTVALQSGGTSLETGVPGAAYDASQRPPMQATALHALFGEAQSLERSHGALSGAMPIPAGLRHPIHIPPTADAMHDTTTRVVGRPVKTGAPVS